MTEPRERCQQIAETSEQCSATVTTATKNEPKTYGDLKRIVAAEPRGEWPSRVNPSLTHTQALQILADGLATHPNEMTLESTRRGFLYARNVLRECRSRRCLLEDCPIHGGPNPEGS